MSWKTDLDENVRSGIVELLVLQLLTKEDMYGYQIKQELESRTNEVFLVKEGSLYGPLYRLHRRKLVSSKRVLVGEKRFRNYYHIEDTGREYLAYGLAAWRDVVGGVDALFASIEKEKK